jgi:Cof subfamily protein (haloacid dehalogenase superfamily)
MERGLIMIKLFASDLDGTLLKNHQVDDYLRTQLNDLLAKGAYISIATGRNAQQAMQGNLPCTHVVCMNGAAIYNAKMEMIYSNPLPKDILAKMLDEMPQMSLEYVTDHGVYATCSKEVFLNEHSAADPKEFPADDKGGLEDFVKDHHFNCSKEEILKQNVLKANMVCANIEWKEKMNAFIAQNADSIRNAGSYPWIYELTAKDVSKATGLLHLASLLNLKPEEVAVYGDGGNDVDMLETFAFSYVPSDGQPSAKAAAHYEIGPHDTYSVVHHMKDTFEHGK